MFRAHTKTVGLIEGYVSAAPSLLNRFNVDEYFGNFTTRVRKDLFPGISPSK